MYNLLLINKFSRWELESYLIIADSIQINLVRLIVVRPQVSSPDEIVSSKGKHKVKPYSRNIKHTWAYLTWGTAINNNFSRRYNNFVLSSIDRFLHVTVQIYKQKNNYNSFHFHGVWRVLC